MQEIYLQFFHDDQSFTDLTFAIYDNLAICKRYLEEEWFKQGILTIWLKDGKPRLNNKLMRESIFSMMFCNIKNHSRNEKVKNTGCHDVIQDYYNEQIAEAKKGDWNNLSESIYLFDLLDARLKFDRIFTIKEEVLIKLIEHRFMPPPYCNHPVFATLANEDYRIVTRHFSAISRLEGKIEDKEYKEIIAGNDRNIFNYYQDIPGTEVHKSYDWNRLFGSENISFVEEEDKIKKKGKKYIEQLRDKLLSSFDEWTTRSKDNRIKLKHGKDARTAIEKGFSGIQGPAFCHAMERAEIHMQEQIEEAKKNKYKATPGSTSSSNHMMMPTHSSNTGASSSSSSHNNIGFNNDQSNFCITSHDNPHTYDQIFAILQSDNALGNCPEGVTERLRLITKTYYNEKTLNLRGSVDQEIMAFIETRGDMYGKYLIQTFHKLVPEKYRKLDWWEMNSPKQASFITNKVKHILSERLSSHDLASYITKKLDKGDPRYWLCLYICYLEDPNQDTTNHIDTWNNYKSSTGVLHNDSFLLTRIQQLFIDYNYHFPDIKHPTVSEMSEEEFLPIFMLENNSFNITAKTIMFWLNSTDYNDQYDTNQIKLNHDLYRLSDDEIARLTNDDINKLISLSPKKLATVIARISHPIFSAKFKQLILKLLEAIIINQAFEHTWLIRRYKQLLNQTNKKLSGKQTLTFGNTVFRKNRIGTIEAINSGDYNQIKRSVRISAISLTSLLQELDGISDDILDFYYRWRKPELLQMLQQTDRNTKSYLMHHCAGFNNITLIERILNDNVNFIHDIAENITDNDISKILFSVRIKEENQTSLLKIIILRYSRYLRPGENNNKSIIATSPINRRARIFINFLRLLNDQTNDNSNTEKKTSDHQEVQRRIEDIFLENMPHIAEKLSDNKECRTYIFMVFSRILKRHEGEAHFFSKLTSMPSFNKMLIKYYEVNLAITNNTTLEKITQILSSYYTTLEQQAISHSSDRSIKNPNTAYLQETQLQLLTLACSHQNAEQFKVLLSLRTDFPSTKEIVARSDLNDLYSLLDNMLGRVNDHRNILEHLLFPTLASGGASYEQSLYRIIEDYPHSLTGNSQTPSHNVQHFRAGIIKIYATILSYSDGNTFNKYFNCLDHKIILEILHLYISDKGLFDRRAFIKNCISTLSEPNNHETANEIIPNALLYCCRQDKAESFQIFFDILPANLQNSFLDSIKIDEQCLLPFLIKNNRYTTFSTIINILCEKQKIDTILKTYNGNNILNYALNAYINLSSSTGTALSTIALENTNKMLICIRSKLEHADLYKLIMPIISPESGQQLASTRDNTSTKIQILIFILKDDKQKYINLLKIADSSGNNLTHIIAQKYQKHLISLLNINSEYKIKSLLSKNHNGDTPAKLLTLTPNELPPITALYTQLIDRQENNAADRKTIAKLWDSCPPYLQQSILYRNTLSPSNILQKLVKYGMDDLAIKALNVSADQFIKDISVNPDHKHFPLESLSDLLSPLLDTLEQTHPHNNSPLRKTLIHILIKHLTLLKCNITNNYAQNSTDVTINLNEDHNDGDIHVNLFKRYLILSSKALRYAITFDTTSPVSISSLSNYIVFISACYGNIEIYQTATKNNNVINFSEFTDATGRTPLHHAASNSSSDGRVILDILLNSTTIQMIATKDNQGSTVLHTAIKSNNQSAVNSIINKMKAMTSNANIDQGINIVDNLILEKNHNNENCLELSIKMGLPSIYILLEKSITNKKSFDLAELFNKVGPKTIKSIINDLLKSDYKSLQYHFYNYINRNDTDKVKMLLEHIDHTSSFLLDCSNTTSSTLLSQMNNCSIDMLQALAHSLIPNDLVALFKDNSVEEHFNILIKIILCLPDKFLSKNNSEFLMSLDYSQQFKIITCLLESLANSENLDEKLLNHPPLHLLNNDFYEKLYASTSTYNLTNILLKHKIIIPMSLVTQSMKLQKYAYPIMFAKYSDRVHSRTVFNSLLQSILSFIDTNKDNQDTFPNIAISWVAAIFNDVYNKHFCSILAKLFIVSVRHSYVNVIEQIHHKLSSNAILSKKDLLLKGESTNELALAITNLDKYRASVLTYQLDSQSLLYLLTSKDGDNASNLNQLLKPLSYDNILASTPETRKSAITLFSMFLSMLDENETKQMLLSADGGSTFLYHIFSMYHLDVLQTVLSHIQNSKYLDILFTKEPESGRTIFHHGYAHSRLYPTKLIKTLQLYISSQTDKTQASHDKTKAIRRVIKKIHTLRDIFYSSPIDYDQPPYINKFITYEHHNSSYRISLSDTFFDRLHSEDNEHKNDGLSTIRKRFFEKRSMSQNEKKLSAYEALGKRTRNNDTIKNGGSRTKKSRTDSLLDNISNTANKITRKRKHPTTSTTTTTNRF